MDHAQYSLKFSVYASDTSVVFRTLRKQKHIPQKVFNAVKLGK